MLGPTECAVPAGMCREPQAGPGGPAGLGGVGAQLPAAEPPSSLGTGSKVKQESNFKDSGSSAGRLSSQGELGLTVGRRGGEVLLRLATPIPAPRDLPPKSRPTPPPAPPAPSIALTRDAERLQHRPRVAPDPSLWEAGSGNQEVTEEQEAGGQGAGRGSRGRGRGHAWKGGAGGCRLEPGGQEHEESGRRLQGHWGGPWASPAPPNFGSL